jgi:hypothetical protein
MRKLIIGFIFLSFHYLALTQAFRPGTIGNNQTIPYGSAPAALGFITGPSGGTLPYSYQWQRSFNSGVTYSNIPGALLAVYSPPVLGQTTMFRCRVMDATNITDYTNSVTISVFTGTIGNNQTIPYSSAPAALRFITGPSGGITPYSLQWQRSYNLGITYTNITGATATIYYPSVLGQTTMFRCRITDAASLTIYTNSVTITVLPNLIPGTIGSAQTICYNTTPAGLTGPATTGGTSPYSYQWQYSINGLSWSNIQGATLTGYSPGNLTVDTWYRRFVSDATGRAMASNTVKITVYPQITLAQLHDNITIDENTSTNFNVVITGGTTPYTVNYTRNGIAQPAVNNYVSGTDIYTGILTGGVYTYALTSVTDANGCAAQSLGTNITITANINGNLAAGSIGSAQTICYNTIPSPLTQITAPTGGTGIYTFQWQSSADNSAWTDISGATLSGYTPPALSATTYYRRIVTSGSYLPVPSASVMITVSPQVTLAQLHDDITIDKNTSTNFNIGITGGTSPFTINYTQNGAAQPTINNYISGTNISTGILSVGNYIYTLTSVIDANGCVAQDLGTSITVTASNTTETLFTTEVPGWWGNDNRYELGTEFRVLSAGFITKVRLYSNIIEGGDHIIRLWMYNGSTYTLVAGPYTWNFSSGYQGWREYELPSAIEVFANTRYIISITNSGDYYYSVRGNFISATTNEHISYIRGLYTTSLGSVPTFQYETNCYFRDIVFRTIDINGRLTAGSVGSIQAICQNTTPAPLTQVTAPTGGTGVYTYQWQSSIDNSTWTDIGGATSEGYSPQTLSASTYFRCTVTSGTYVPVHTNSVLITFSPQITLAQLHDNITIINNSSTFFFISITGGTSPFTVNYTRNDISQPTINNYVSGTNISTGILPEGTYVYALTSVTDAFGCNAQNPGTSINVTATENGNLTAGSIVSAQTICYNSIPATLTQLTAPTGGTGEYTYQWQSSLNNSSWSDIAGATSQGYAPQALLVSTYFRCTVISGTYLPVYSNSVLITVSPQTTLAQLHDDIYIDENVSTNFNIVISGGTSPFAVNYTRNGEAQPTINNYISGTNISTGALSEGNYIYTLTSVIDANGCVAQNLGTSITVTASSIIETLFTTEVPGLWGSDSRYELGTEFQVLSAGFITKMRLYSNINEGGDHDIRLWMYDGLAYTLAAGPYTWNFSSGYQGWREYELPSAIEVFANTRYIISITNSGDYYYSVRGNFISATTNEHISYIRGLYTSNLGSVPSIQYETNCYFRDIVFALTPSNGNLAAGTIGNSQTICYNTTPAPLTQVTAPTGGTGVYTYQWQSSLNNSSWSDIAGATSEGYAPQSLLASTYFRRAVTSGTFIPVHSNPVLITISPRVSHAQLYDNITIINNSSTFFFISITGGTSPFTVNYTRNEVSQPAIYSYISGNLISTGVLTTGTYNYVLTSVIDGNGCVAQNPGTSITVTVTDDPNSQFNSNKALVIVNSSSVYYSHFTNYIIPYLDNFGFPYDVCDVSSASLPPLNEYAVLIFGHKNVYSSGYPIGQIESAVSGGVGLCSFDPHLFDYESGFNIMTTGQSVNSSTINISNTTHYITRNHAWDTYNLSNDRIDLLSSMTVVHNSSLINSMDLASLSSNDQTVPLLQVANYGNGRIVRWNSYDWVFDEILGPVYGMDDLFWRGIVWSARKPFVMQGLPPMITMRIDDVNGTGGALTNDFEWIRICNEYGIKPWCGTFNNEIPLVSIPSLKTLLDNNLATASPHAFTSNNFIYFNHNYLGSFDPAENTRQAMQFYLQNGLKISKFIVPHYYEISSSALPEIHNMGCEFVGIQMLPDNTYGAPWINNGPFRINRYGSSGSGNPVYYADNNIFNGLSFFNCLTEIRDDGGYEWYPINNVPITAARGIRHLRRSLNSMVITTLFTHEAFFDDVSISNFREILSTITSVIAGYNPEYTTLDYAIQYIRAKKNIRVTNVVEYSLNLEISYSGSNDMTTKCYLFTGQDDQITYRFISLPQINGSGTVSVLK